MADGSSPLVLHIDLLDCSSSVTQFALTESIAPCRRCVLCAPVVPEAGSRTAFWEARSGRQEQKRSGDGALWTAVAFSLFSSSDEDKKDEAERKKDEMILLLKKAKLSLHRGNLQAASSYLHQAVALAHQTHNNQAIIYTYSQVIYQALRPECHC
ncbi:PREDICTED: tetratricopeptide repeat protein 19, mitochondrial-like [Cyprinodon variegatus]|uniref:tetratricopeptide repeat protein 19, mitochondrial-like n=1 Tax=Cyprinodon variegatus TaxID=28743 RepID=UPI000742B315|nr:PREDICTED: tetratricopeptide repeat protein 19, mitochondrial-like [Cyprinodon variegatus]